MVFLLLMRNVYLKKSIHEQRRHTRKNANVPNLPFVLSECVYDIKPIFETVIKFKERQQTIVIL